jgi:hypothetical protein
MGAGTKKQHFIQDAGEKYCVYQLQKMAVEKSKAITHSYLQQEKEFNDYCQLRSIKKDFDSSEYKKIYDNNLSAFFAVLAAKHPDCSFDFKDIEVEYRNQNKKGDFLISFSDGSPCKSFSLKTYKKGYSRVQLCSGTWQSLVLNVLLPKQGVGMYTTLSGAVHRGSDITKTKQNLKSRGLWTEDLQSFFSWYDDIVSRLRRKYVNGLKAKYWPDIEQDWKRDCSELSHQAIDKVIEVFASLPNNKIKNRLMKMADFYGEEELLLLDHKGYLCSYFNNKYKTMLRRLNSAGCWLSFKKHGKSIRFIFRDDEGDIATVDVPFTLQANGAWHRPKCFYEGAQYHAKENKFLLHGERRPKKSKEIATSINTYFKLKEALLA